MDIANIPNWHRYLIALLLTIGGVCTALVSGVLPAPPALQVLLPWLAIVAFGVTTFMAMLPRVQLPTGPGAKPIISPPEV